MEMVGDTFDPMDGVVMWRGCSKLRGGIAAGTVTDDVRSTFSTDLDSSSYKESETGLSSLNSSSRSCVLVSIFFESDVFIAGDGLGCDDK